MVIRPRRPFEWVEIIWRRKRVLFLMALVMMIAAYVIIRRLPAVYESRARIVVTHYPQGPDDPVGEGASFTSVVAYLKSRGNLAALIQRYKLYPDAKKFDFALDLLDKGIKLNVINRKFGYPEVPEEVHISYRYPDATIPQKLVADLVSNFERANEAVRQRASGELASLKGKIEEVEKRLQELGPVRDLEVIRAQVAARQATEDAANRTQRLAVGTMIESLTDKEYTLGRQIAELKRQIEEQKKIVSSTMSNGVPTTNPATAALIIRRAELEAKIRSYSEEYTEKNPKLIEARGQLAMINKELSKLEAGVSSGSVAYSSPEATELKRMELELNRLQTEYDVTRRDLARKKSTMDTLPAGAGNGAALLTPGADQGGVAGVPSDTKTEHERLVERYKALLGKQDDLQKLAGIAGSSTPMFQILDPPSMPTVPVAPNRRLLFLFAMIFAVGFGLVIILILELPRFFIFSDERDVQYFLGAPVLALIPETVSHSERGRHRRLRWTRNLVLLLFAAAIIPFLIVLIDRMGVFQILGSR
jgi:polysaccharide biosynthesis transport protein